MGMKNIFRAQKEFFNSGATRSYSARRSRLEKLKHAVLSRESDLYEALALDLGKGVMEAFTTEIGYSIGEIDHTLRHLSGWMRPRKKILPLLYQPGSAMIRPEPYGVSLIVAPWNYPFQLVISPLIGSVAAGNTAIVKPSHNSPHTTALLADILEEAFPPEWVTLVDVKPQGMANLLEQPFDFIFYTGSTKVGKVVAEAASKNLTPVVLELGGKSPCIVDSSADLEIAAKRILWGKFVNAGQTCVAPDFLVVHKDVKEGLLKEMQKAHREFYGGDPEYSVDYARIVNRNHMKRLLKIMKGDIVAGGRYSLDKLFMELTIIDNVNWDSPLMEEEIFGPILPVLEYQEMEDVIFKIASMPKPLALYLFTKQRWIMDMVMDRVPSGGVCINHTLLHVGPGSLPFGGIGPSGMGTYHGKASFDAFSHKRSVMIRPFFKDSSLFYPPYKRMNRWMQKLYQILG